MPLEECLRLRRKQLLLTYSSVTIVIAIAIILVTQVTLQSLILYCTIFSVMAYLNRLILVKTGRFAWTKDMRKLAQFEKEVLGDEAFYTHVNPRIFLVFGNVFTVVIYFTLYDTLFFSIPDKWWWKAVATFAILILILTGRTSWRMQRIHRHASTIRAVQSSVWTISLTYIGIVILISGLLITYL